MNYMKHLKSELENRELESGRLNLFSITLCNWNLKHTLRVFG
jgi:hypothetical protein